MNIPPFWGPPGDGFWAPDPIIYWFVVPVVGYVWAVIQGVGIAGMINFSQAAKRALDKWMEEQE